MSYRCSTYSGSSDKDLAELRARVSSEDSASILARFRKQHETVTITNSEVQIRALIEAHPPSPG